MCLIPSTEQIIQEFKDSSHCIILFPNGGKIIGNGTIQMAAHIMESLQEENKELKQKLKSLEK